MAKWCTIVARNSEVADVNIFDAIGFGYTVSDFERDLAAVGDRRINVRLNTPGGDVFTGFAIYNILNRIRDRVTVTVEGIAASMGSVIMMAGKTRIMPANAAVMIHDPAGMAEGGPEELANFAAMLSNVRDQIVAAYVKATGQPEDKIRQMMKDETWLSAEQAIKLGFADKIEKPIKMAAVAKFDLGCFTNVPENFGTNEEDVDMNDQIKRLCALFGKPELADGFINAKKSLDDVMAALEAQAASDKTAKAAADRAAEAEANKGKDTAKVREQVLAYVGEVRTLCSMAGMADKADGFINADKSISEVIVALDAAKKEAGKSGKDGNGAGTEVSAHNRQTHQGERKAAVIDTAAIYDRMNGKRKAS